MEKREGIVSNSQNSQKGWRARFGAHRQTDSPNHTARISGERTLLPSLLNTNKQEGTQAAVTDALSLLPQECNLSAATAPTKDTTLMVCILCHSRTVDLGV